MKIYFTLILTSLYFFGYTQNLTTESSQLIINQGDYIDYGSLTLNNAGGNDIELAITLTPECYVPEDVTTVQICMGDLCFTPVSTETTWTSGSQNIPLAVVSSGQDWNDFKFDPFSDDTHSSAWIITFFDRNNPDDQISIDVIVGDLAECSALSIDEIQQESAVGKAFPNPVNESVSIPFINNSSNNAFMVVYNSIGAIQEKMLLESAKGQVLLNTADYPNGIYFYNIVQQDGGIIPGHSFIK